MTSVMEEKDELILFSFWMRRDQKEKVLKSIGRETAETGERKSVAKWLREAIDIRLKGE